MTNAAELVMPKLGLTMTEGRVAQWMVKPGAQFDQGDVIVVIETDKIANDVEAPAAGQLIDILVEEGSVVPVGAPIAKWKLEGTHSQAKSTERGDHSRVTDDVLPATPDANAQVKSQLRAGARIVATPLARRMARDANLDLADLTGTGPNGRIKAVDVEKALALRGAAEADQQLAASTSLPERAPESSAARLSFATIDINVDALLAIQASLTKSGNGAFELRDYIALACARTLASDRPPVRLGIELPGVRGPVGFLVERGETLSSLASKRASLEQNSSMAEESTGGDVVILATEAPLHVFAPAAPVGWGMALGVGSIRRIRGGADGALHELSLALSYDTASRDHASSARLLGSVKAFLEEPLQLLAS